VIVGFPGEDDHAFQMTRDLLESLPLAGLHVFGYSRRVGTEAAGLAAQVPRAVRKERSRVLRGLAAQKGEEFRRRFVGAVLEAVVLHRDGEPGRREGLTDNYLRVWFPGESALQGSRVRVRVDGVTDRGLEGIVSGSPGIGRSSPGSGESVDSPETVK
jgi:threonylcarbamoyladenosine tRNA methylthiotransferase MtaB